MHPRRSRRPTGGRARHRHAAPRQSLPVRLAARVVIGVLVPLLGVTWLAGSSDVTLQVDGRPQTLTTYARTVDELLDRAGVPISPNDEIVPAPSTRLRDGMVVEVVHAREITLLMGDNEQTVFVTALSVDEVIDQLAKRRGVSRRSLVRPARFTPVVDGMTVELLEPVAVTVVVGGKQRQVVTDAGTVGGVVDRMGVRLDGNDRLTPEPQTQVSEGMRIIVERVRITRERDDVAIPHPTDERPTDELTAGEQRVIQQGRDGLAEVVARVTFVDGQEVLRTPVKRTVIRQPSARIVEVGTATAAPRRADTASASRTRSESEPAPASTSPQPQPEPEPEPTSAEGNSQSGQASYYYHPEEGMTAAHRTLPLGTVVTVTNRANGKSIKVTINDRGPYIDGRIIDLNEPAFTQIAAKASGVIDVRITW